MATRKPAGDPPETDPDDDLDTDTSGKSGLEKRLARVAAQRRDLRKQLDEAHSKIEELEDAAAAFAKQAKQFESVQAELDGLKSERDGWSTEKALVAAGLTDPEGIDLAKLAYGRIKPEDRPKGGISEWLKGDGVPKGVKSYLPAADPPKDPKAPAAGAKPGQPPVPPARQPANTDRNARPAPGAPATFAPGSVSGMNQQELAASQEAIWASLGMQVPNIPGLKPATPKV